ncbi:histone deacetylase 6 [Diachasma alloeum]|uniref:histone deacetylase 6 n=1 Tax=Diachasma alloeum TaxID=454923 RepID=UPI0007384D54|nr:histone deacetylase 6 [Diachasma alloeum]
MSNPEPRNNFFNAVRQLAESEIHLIKVIENSRKEIHETMSTKQGLRSNEGKRSSRLAKVRPSQAIIVAKREAAQKRKTQKNSDSCYVRDIYQTAIDSKNMIRGPTGVVYDRSMAEHRCLWDDKYPECPERFTRVLERCQELGLIERCKFIEPRLARIDEVLLKHSMEQIDILKGTEGCQDAERLENISSKYDAIYIHPSTYKLSLLAAGSTINLFESICRGEVQNGMAIIRPPGHHAMKSEYCGYCFFNNVAIASEKILAEGLAKRILIVDWDVHHGQATQQMFYDDPRVVYFSIHRYENGSFWPNLRESDYHYVGAGAGVGHNFNVPLNKTGMTNGDYLAIFQQVLLPMAYEYQPDLVVISAGYDAAFGCPEGEMEITPAFYAHLLSPLLGLANGKVAVILEGGYCLESLSESAALTLRTLLGDPCPVISTLAPPSPTITETILNVIYTHKPYWGCYQYQDTYSVNSGSGSDDIVKHLPKVVYEGDETKPEFYQTRDCYPVQSETQLNEIHNRLVLLKQMTSLSRAPHRVCLVYDDRMLRHFNYAEDSHPETPKRISEIFSMHEEYGLIERCHVLEGRAATEEELSLVHTKEHIGKMQQTAESKPSELTKQSRDLDSVFLHKETWTSASIAAGSLLRVVDSVLNGESQSGVAVVRPPGHHAGEEEACGFCIFNNISVAARYATEFHGLKRVLIVDWDVHHGNGTQSILEEDPKILYMSVHRYDNGAFFPASKDANYDVVGTGRGKGFNVNIPWNRRKMGDPEYVAAFQQIILPIAYQFNPELVLISAGFDACVGDPLGHYTVSPEAYGLFTHWLSPLANGRLILALEGGYNVNSISHAMTMCTKALLNDPLPPLRPLTAPCSSAITSIKNVLKTQKTFWPNLVFQAALPRENVLPEASAPGDETPGSEQKIADEQFKTEKGGKIDDLAAKVERMTLRNPTNCVRECVNPGEKPRESSGAGGSGASGSGGSSGGRGAAAAGQTLQEFLSENFQALNEGEMFAVVPLNDCPHLELVQEVPPSGIDVRSPCLECKSTEENWVCLICYSTHCARSVNQHAVVHGESLEHPIALSLTDLSVWCYGCEAYVDNPKVYTARNRVHLAKFGEELPWTYNEFTLN